MDLVFI